MPDGTTTISFHPQKGNTALSIIQKVELVSPAPEPKKVWRLLLKLLFELALRVLIVFWFFASWFPELGLTYWGLVLPVYIAMWIFRAPSQRQIPERYLRRRRKYDFITDDVIEEVEELAEPIAKK